MRHKHWLSEQKNWFDLNATKYRKHSNSEFVTNLSFRNSRTTLGQILNINTWQDNRTSNPLIKEHNEHNLTQVDAINNFYFYLPRWSGRPSTGSGRTTTWTTSSMWSLSSTRRCASTAVSLPFFRHLLHFLLHLSTWIYLFLSTLLIDRQENATWRATIRATRRYLSTNKRTFLRSRMTMR